MAQERLGEVVVTGTRIARQDYQATSPVTTLTSEAFELSGEPQVEKILNEMPQLVPSITTTSNNPSNGGQANINLRGLGTARTLVLMDGTRMQPSNVSGLIDLNTVPAALIDSVEILTGGASSVYGSDAVAGVVNVRMKRDFEGVQIGVQHGVTEESDGDTLTADVTMGGDFADGRGNAVVALSYDDREEVLAGARAFGEVSLGPLLTPVGSGTVPDGGIGWGANAPSQAALDAVFGAYGVAAGTVPPAATIGINTNGTVFSFGRGTTAQPVANYLGDTSDPGFNPLSYSYNFGPVNYLQLPLQRKQAAAFLRYDLVPDVVEIYSRVTYTTYNADQQLAATPVSAGVGTSVPVSNTAIPADLRTLLNARPTPGANFTLGRRFTEVGPRTQSNNYEVSQVLLGVRGELFDDWRWDVFGSWGHLQNVNIQGGNVSRSRLNSALTNPAFYASRGCAEFNPFGAGNIAPACAQAIAIRASNILETEQLNLEASFTGSLFDMPAGPLQMAVGIGYLENKADFRPDEFLASGDVVGFNAQQPVSGKIDVVEPFIEFAVPLLSGKPFADYLGLDLGYRYSDYNLAGEVNTYKAGLQWRPVESFQVRAGYNRAIRAPNINELFLPQQENFPTYADPCNFNSAYRTGPNAAAVTALCQSQGIPAGTLPTYTQAFSQARAFIGGNTELEPETADTYTVGFAWQSDAESELARDLSISVDYYTYEVADAISSLSVNSIVGRCFNDVGANPSFDPNNQWCQLFVRDPSTFRPDEVATTNLNLGGLEHEGIDLQVDWGFPLSAMGASESAGGLNFRLIWTHLLHKATQETVADLFYDYDGTISQTVGSANPTNKAVLTTTWKGGDFSVRYNLRYIDSMDVVNNNAQYTTPTIGVAPSVSSYVYHDLAAQWERGKYSATLGVNNIADKDPPVYTTDAQAGIQSNTDPSTYDVLGRRFFLSLGMKF
jgi:iron complex outermembrane receptor protein